MKNYFLILFFIFIIWGMGVPPAWADNEPVFDFALLTPESPEDRQYLGLPDSGPTFLLSQLDTPIILIEIFSMYCPICQREAATVNRLFDLIQADKQLNGRVKILGIGAGNSDFETGFFRSTYQIPFPLVSDRNFMIHKKVGEVGTPHFFGLHLQPGNRIELFFTHSGAVEDPKKFLNRLKKSSGMETTP